MANKDLFKQAIAEAKSVREAAIANAKEALEETLTPHLKDMLAAKLQEMEDSQSEEEVVSESEDEDTVEENMSGFEAVKAKKKAPVKEAEEDEEEAEDDSEESEDEAEEVELDAEETEEDEAEDDSEDLEGDEDLSDLSVDQFRDLVKDIIAQELEGGDAEMELGADMDAGDIEGMGDEEGDMEEPGLDSESEPGMEQPEMGAEEEDGEEIDLEELLRELEAAEVSEGDYGDEEEDEAELEEKAKSKYKMEENEAKLAKAYAELDEALETIEVMKGELSEINILNSKLLYVNRIFKANNLTEQQKVNIIAAFDKAETVKEVKLVFETVSDSVVNTRKTQAVTESKIGVNASKLGRASKATGITAKKPEVINEVSDAVKRMQKLAGII